MPLFVSLSHSLSVLIMKNRGLASSQRLEETTQVRQAFRTLTASKILKTARRQERADEVDRMERRRELDEDVLEYLVCDQEACACGSNRCARYVC